MKIKDIAKAVDSIAPKALALDWDNTGLLVGDMDADVKNILMTIDITKDVLQEAKKFNAQLILSYHPVIWDGLKTVTANGPGSIVYELIRSKINVYSIHTAFDIVLGGVNDELANMLGIENPQPIGDFVNNPAEEKYKLIVFVPVEAVNKVSNALFKAGAGAIGKYSNCSFQSGGTGTFLPLEGAKPAIGQKGTLENVSEIKLETIVPAGCLKDVIAAMRSAHPYEEPAFDVFKNYDQPQKFGLGRIGCLAKPASMTSLIDKIKKTTSAKAMGFIGKQNRTVKKAAVCAGSCSKIINDVIAQGCDLYVTGELKHHQALAAQEAGLSCICLSHTVSERFALKNLLNRLKKPLNPVKIRLSNRDADPFEWKNV
ncbi:MAG: Nif3-like dinuclear metal center hexameric protein [Victivallales bacterium]|nr:Nif3-like dinuclear metal center hexameric protein [Victivallales bacterium]